jgi:cytochrome c-type biogenesis protein CcmH
MNPSFLVLVAVLGALVIAWLGWPLLRPAPGPMAWPMHAIPTRPALRNRWPLLIGALAVTLAAAGAAWWRSHEAAASPPADAARAAAVARVQVEVELLRSHVQEHPDDAAAWEKLGVSHAALGHRTEALEALRRARSVRPDDATVLAELALAIVVADPKDASDEPARLVARALELEPANAKALAFAGTLALQRKDYAAAIRYWETLARIEPPDSAVGRQLQVGLAEAHKRIDIVQRAASSPAGATRNASRSGARGTGAATAVGHAEAGHAEPGPAPGGSAHVGGHVSLAAALRARVEPDDTVFVYARATEPGHPPLAVLRRKVRDLPFAFTLDDTLAMAPDAHLSAAERVVVGARISKSGQAVALPGDLEGHTEPVTVGRSDLELEIDRIVPARP